MDKFIEIFNRLMKHEGGYVNNPRDPGGETMYGVTKRVAVAHGYTGPMRQLPLATAKAITEKSYFKAIRGDELDRLVAWQLTDAAYNHGNRQAVKFLQRAVGFTGNAVDGLIGPRTIAAVAAKDKNDVVFLFCAERLEFYTNLGTWATFGRGWARRVAQNLRYAAIDN
jgi:lysozyme family protein